MRSLDDACAQYVDALRTGRRRLALDVVEEAQAAGYGLLWLLIGFAGIAVINGLLFTRVFSTYIAAQSAPQGK